MDSGNSNRQSTLMKVLLVLMIVILILIVAACFLIPAVVKNSANTDDENTAKDATVSVNITNSVPEGRKVEPSSDIPAANIIIVQNDEVCSGLDSSYILAFSSSRKLIPQDIKYFNLEELVLARNEIFARHGYVFNTLWIKQYFHSKSWYVPNPSYKGSLNSIEEYNVHLIKEYEKALK